MGIAETLRRLVADELAGRSEPWARTFLDPGTGQPHPDVVATLAQVGAGLEGESADSPLSDEASREPIAVWLVDTVLVDPDHAKVGSRPQFQTGIRLQFDERGEMPPSERALDILAELALGASGEAHPRAVRLGAPDLVVDAYLRGAQVAQPLTVVAEAVTVSTPVPVEAPAPRRQAPARRGKAPARKPARKKVRAQRAGRPRRAKPRQTARAAVKRARAKQPGRAGAKGRGTRKAAARTQRRTTKAPVRKPATATKRATKRAPSRASTASRGRAAAAAKARRKKK